MVLSLVMFDICARIPPKALLELAGPVLRPAQFVRPVTLHLKQEPESDIHPFAFKPLQLANLGDPPEYGRIDVVLRGLGHDVMMCRPIQP
jgi:hypothetical protein